MMEVRMATTTTTTTTTTTSMLLLLEQIRWHEYVEDLTFCPGVEDDDNDELFMEHSHEVDCDEQTDKLERTEKHHLRIDMNEPDGGDGGGGGGGDDDDDDDDLSSLLDTLTLDSLGFMSDLLDKLEAGIVPLMNNMDEVIFDDGNEESFSSDDGKYLEPYSLKTTMATIAETIVDEDSNVEEDEESDSGTTSNISYHNGTKIRRQETMVVRDDSQRQGTAVARLDESISLADEEDDDEEDGDGEDDDGEDDDGEDDDGNDDEDDDEVEEEDNTVSVEHNNTRKCSMDQLNLQKLGCCDTAEMLGKEGGHVDDDEEEEDDDDNSVGERGLVQQGDPITTNSNSPRPLQQVVEIGRCGSCGDENEYELVSVPIPEWERLIDEDQASTGQVMQDNENNNSNSIIPFATTQREDDLFQHQPRVEDPSQQQQGQVQPSLLDLPPLSNNTKGQVVKSSLPDDNDDDGSASVPAPAPIREVYQKVSHGCHQQKPISTLSSFRNQALPLSTFIDDDMSHLFKKSFAAFIWAGQANRRWIHFLPAITDSSDGHRPMILPPVAPTTTYHHHPNTNLINDSNVDKVSHDDLLMASCGDGGGGGSSQGNSLTSLVIREVNKKVSASPSSSSSTSRNQALLLDTFIDDDVSHLFKSFAAFLWTGQGNRSWVHLPAITDSSDHRPMMMMMMPPVPTTSTKNVADGATPTTYHHPTDLIDDSNVKEVSRIDLLVTPCNDDGDGDDSKQGSSSSLTTSTAGCFSLENFLIFEEDLEDLFNILRCGTEKV